MAVSWILLLLQPLILFSFFGIKCKRSGLKPETLMKSPYAKLKSLPFYEKMRKKRIYYKRDEDLSLKDSSASAVVSSASQKLFFHYEFLNEVAKDSTKIELRAYFSFSFTQIFKNFCCNVFFLPVCFFHPPFHISFALEFHIQVLFFLFNTSRLSLTWSHFYCWGLSTVFGT